MDTKMSENETELYGDDHRGPETAPTSTGKQVVDTDVGQQPCESHHDDPLPSPNHNIDQPVSSGVNGAPSSSPDASGDTFDDDDTIVNYDALYGHTLNEDEPHVNEGNGATFLIRRDASSTNDAGQPQYLATFPTYVDLYLNQDTLTRNHIYLKETLLYDRDGKNFSRHSYDTRPEMAGDALTLVRGQHQPMPSHEIPTSWWTLYDAATGAERPIHLYRTINVPPSDTRGEIQYFIYIDLQLPAICPPSPPLPAVVGGGDPQMPGEGEIGPNDVDDPDHSPPPEAPAAVNVEPAVALGDLAPPRDPLREFNCPIETEDNFLTMDRLLSADPLLRAAMVNRLSEIGGKNLGQCLRLTLQHLMAPAVRRRLNWKGRNGKNAFEGLALKDVLYEAMRRDHVGAKDYEIKKLIQDWLKGGNSSLN